MNALQSSYYPTLHQYVNGTPLHLFAQQNVTTLAKLFIDYGADVNLSNSKGDTALHLAVQGHDLEMVKLLLDHPILILVLIFVDHLV